jgi:DUF1126 PH-like domain
MSVLSTAEIGYLPNLPGYRSREVHTHGYKKSCFNIVAGQLFLKDEALPSLTVTGVNGEEEFLGTGSVLSIGAQSASPTKAKLLKAGLGNSNLTLTFQAYFEDSSSFSSSVTDAYRVRKCTVYYFVETAQLQIVEKPKQNSGIVEGTLVRRAVINKEDGTPYMPYDFRIGAEIVVYGRKFKLVDCDMATRQYLRNTLGITESAALSVPRDPHEESRKLFERGPSDKWDQYRAKKNDNKTFLEASLGKTVNNKGREGFIRFGNQTLRFRCVWDNTTMLYGDRKEFSLVYYLSDDTMEIFSVPTPNSDTFTKLLKRSKLPKDLGEMFLGERDGVKGPDFYTWRDFFIGLELNVYARVLRVVDSDSSTRAFYAENHIPLEDAEPQQAPIGKTSFAITVPLLLHIYFCLVYH